VERETTVARQRAQNAQTAIMEKLKDITTAENTGTTTRKHKTTVEEMSNAIGDRPSDLASSDDDQDGDDKEDDEDDTMLGKLSVDDEPGWVMGSISNTVRHHMESFWRSR